MKLKKGKPLRFRDKIVDRKAMERRRATIIRDLEGIQRKLGIYNGKIVVLDGLDTQVPPRIKVEVQFEGSTKMEATGTVSRGLDDEVVRSPSEAKPQQPPVNAEFILHLLLRKGEHEGLIGDLVELYGRKCARLGVRRANLWFYAEIFWTALPLIKRAIIKGGLIALGEWIRRHIS